MALLTQEELDLRKREARKREIRQNVKSHCTKIKEGIRKNGSTSGNRAIWELFQNAGDLSRDGRADIKITLTENEFVFAHKGKPFTNDTLCSLVKQVSSEDKENEDTVGQYGTGFLTTHKFGYNIKVNGSMVISDDPKVYVDIDDFLIKRENYDDIPAFIEDMTIQIENVGKLMDKEQKSAQREWTELKYELKEGKLAIVQTAIDEAIKLMPYVLTINDNIGSCMIEDRSREIVTSFSKSNHECATQNLLCTEVCWTVNGGQPTSMPIYYLELHNGDSRVILPLESETKVRSLGEVPRLFVHYPLIGQNFFGVNFIFHSHLFTPEEPRDNIIVPRDNDATAKVATENKRVLDEMTSYLWKFLEENAGQWQDTIKAASIDIKDSGHTEKPTEDYYKGLKSAWVDEFCKLPIMEIGGKRYSMSNDNHPQVFESSLYAFLSQEENEKFLHPLYEYAKGAGLIQEEDDIMEWSRIILNWAPENKEYQLSLEKIVEYVSQNQGDSLHDVLELIVATKNTDFFEKYALIPNRNGVLKRHSELRDANSITEDLYNLVNNLDPKICDKFVDRAYEDIITLTEYRRVNLRDELNSVVKQKENEYWKGDSPSPYGGDFLKNLMEFCSAFTTQNGDSKRNKLMPVLYRFEGVEGYQEKYIPAWPDDEKTFDLYRNIFISLLENQMMKVAANDADWVEKNLEDLAVFVENSRGDDFKGFNNLYSVFPDMNNQLHLPDELKKNEGVHERLFEFYQTIMNVDLRGKCVNERFSNFYDKYNTYNEFKLTSAKVATEIQNKLSADNYTDTKILDIIELTEGESVECLAWRALFKTIYDQRESIRYNLGSDAERKAINRMLKQKNPALMEKMADVAEREDSDLVLGMLNEAIANIEDDAHKKMLGDFVEEHIERYLNDALAGMSINIRNEQGGQDLILSKEGFDDYYIEIKSRWVDKEPAIMSSTQFHKAVECADRYSLVSAQMWTFDQQRVIDKEDVMLDEMDERLRVSNDIGSQEKDLLKKVEEALVYDVDKIHVVADYHVHVPQKLIIQSFNDLVANIKKHFSCQEESGKIEQ